MTKRKKQLRKGLKKTLARVVEFKRTIANYDRRLPPVLSTPSMIGQMEVTAAVFKRMRNEPGKRPRYVFAVDARVGKRLVGDGWVERAVINHPGAARRR